MPKYLIEASYTAEGAKGLAKDGATAAAISLAVAGSGAARAKTTALLTVEELDQAAKKTIDYRPPGQR